MDGLLGCGWLRFSLPRATPTSRALFLASRTWDQFSLRSTRQEPFFPQQRVSSCVKGKWYSCCIPSQLDALLFRPQDILRRLERTTYRNQFIDTVTWMVEYKRTAARRDACKARQSSQPSCLSLMLLLQSISYTRDITTCYERRLR